MQKVSISNRVLEILKAMGVINEGIILKNDYLYTKNDTEDSKAKGIVVEYKLKEEDISLPEEIGINDINRLLKVVGSCDVETLEIISAGTQLKLNDSRKKLTYNTQLTNGLPIKNPQGDALFEKGEDIFTFALEDEERKQIQSDLNLVGVDSISLKGVDGKLKIIASSSITSDDIEIELNQKFVNTCKDKEFVFTNKDLFNLLPDGSFKVQVREVEYSGRIIKIIKLESVTYPGLQYLMTHTES